MHLTDTRSPFWFCFLLLLCSFLLPLSASATVIDNPFLFPEEQTVTGTGTPDDPYELIISGSGNEISTAGMALLLEQAPNTYWYIVHTQENTPDYNLSFFVNDLLQFEGPLPLDIVLTEKKDGSLMVTTGCANSDFPLTIKVPLAPFPSFEGKAAAIVTGDKAETSIDDGNLILYMIQGGTVTVSPPGCSPTEPESPLISIPTESIEPHLPLLHRFAGYEVNGSGTGAAPYHFYLHPQVNNLDNDALQLMQEEAPGAIWLAEHRTDGITDYTLRFSSSFAANATAPFSLDLEFDLQQEGIVSIAFDRGGILFPATLSLDVSRFSGFTDGKSVTITGGANTRSYVTNGMLEIPLDTASDCLLTAAGYEPAAEDIPDEPTEERGTWDTPDENGQTVTEDYVHAGSAELPFFYNLSDTGDTVLTGQDFHDLAEKFQSRLFLWKDPSGTILWSYLVEGQRMTDVPLDAKYDLHTTLNGNTLEIAYPDVFPGKIKATIYVGDKFPNATIVRILGPDGNTAAVVDRGYIQFWVTSGGEYQLEDSGNTVSSRTVTDAKLISESSRDNMYTTQNYKGVLPYGSDDEPLTILGKLDDFFWASWRSINTVAGYSPDMNASEATYDPSRIMNVSIEYRSPSTGKLIASVSIHGGEWRMTPENMKGPYYMDYKLNPSRTVIENTLAHHSLYIGKYADRRPEAVDTLTDLSNSKDYVLFLMSRTRSFAGAIHYKIDMSQYFKPGDIVQFHYLLGSCNGDLYHGEAPISSELLIEEATYSRYDGNYVVDANGYVEFPLYTGGFFVFSKAGQTEATKDFWQPDKTANPEKLSAPSPSETTKELVTEKEIMQEDVVAETHTETGVLTEQRVHPQTETPNFHAEDCGITADGYLSQPAVGFAAEQVETHPGGRAAYHISLTKSSGFPAILSDGDYLELNIPLGGGYSIHDEKLLYLKCWKNESYTDEVFPAHSDLDADGKMQFICRITHPGTYEVFVASSREVLTSAVSLKQEYTAEAATLLAEQSLKHNDEAKTIRYWATATLLVLLICLVGTEIRRKKIK